MRTCDCERNKGEKALGMYDKEDEKKEETVNSRDCATMNTCDNYFGIYECCKKICQLMYTRACKASDYIRDVSMSLEKCVRTCTYSLKILIGSSELEKQILPSGTILYAF